MKWTGLAAALSLAGLPGCGPRQSPAGLAGIPPEGHVRILAKKLREDGRSYVWQWTIIGDRNWTSAGGDGTRFHLSNSYPLNSTTGRGGTHIWEFTATIEPASADRASSLRRELTLRGSHAGRFRSVGSLGAGGATLGETTRTLQTSDATLSIPASVKLLRAGTETVELRIER
jgi:hypothetical protein